MESRQNVHIEYMTNHTQSLVFNKRIRLYYCSMVLVLHAIVIEMDARPCGIYLKRWKYNRPYVAHALTLTDFHRMPSINANA
jgi:hypothetical protein